MRRMWPLLIVLLLAGCRDRQMYSEPKLDPLRLHPMVTSGQLTRLPPPNTVARADVVNLKTPFTTGFGADGYPVKQLPVPVTRELLERGEERYQIFCTPCHGLLGDGQGMVARRGFPHPPSYHLKYLRQAPVGHFFDVMTSGFGRMPPYGDRIPPADRWAIAAYIRVLQRSQDASPGDMPGQARASLEARR